MTGFFNYRYGGNIQRKAYAILKCPDSTLTENDLVISLCQQVIGGGKPFGNSAGKPALQHHGMTALTHIGQQSIILHVARANLEYISVASHQLDIMMLLRHLNEATRLSIVMVLHDLNQAARFSHRLVALRDGAVFATGSPDEVMTVAMLREVFQVEGVVDRDPHTATPVFTPLQSVRSPNGHGGGHDEVD